MRKFLQTLQPSSGGKENLVGPGRIPVQDVATDGKAARPERTFAEADAVVADDGAAEENGPVLAVDPSLYKKLVIEDITSTASPSEKYWEVIAERRRKALKEMIEENRRMCAIVIALEEENKSCKKLLEKTTDLVNTLKELCDENNLCSEDDENLDRNDCSTSDSCSSDRHVNKKIKMSNPDSCASSDSEC